jgi:hypothetical protein
MIKETKISVKCWNPNCENNKKILRTEFKDLTERKENKHHYDYVCPLCEKVIICSYKRLK